MAVHLQRDLERLRREILGVGALVQEAIDKAIRALAQRRPELAREVIAGDDRIDAAEVEVEEECLKILALHQPVAADLRFLVAALKVNNDLERMGDHACNLAERVCDLARLPAIDAPPEFKTLYERVPSMVRGCLDALVTADAQRAREVCRQDRDVDEVNRRMFAQMQERMRKDPACVEAAVSTLSATRQLERIADLATNIAEDVIFLVEGEIVRHGHGDANRPA